MQQIKFTREIPLDDSFDVLVAGGGPAGCAAAVAAAREGAKTLLIEATGALGGMGTMGLVPAWCPFSDGEKMIHRGLAETVFNACKKAMPHIPAGAMDWVAIDPESLKRIYDELAAQAGVTVLFHTSVCAVETDGNGAVTAVVVSNKSGLSAFGANVFVDCTGDGDIAAWAGAEFQKGDERGVMQPATHCFFLTNIDEYAFRCGPALHGGTESIAARMQRSGKYPFIMDGHLCASATGPGTIGFNAGHIWDIDGTAPWSVSKAMAEGRAIARQFRDALAELHPAFANAFLACTAPLMGIRETRRIIGDYVLSIEDYLARRSFDDEICRNAYPIDVHSNKTEAALVKDGRMDIWHRCEHYKKGESHGIPYRCLTPRGLKNILTAGRAISCDRLTHGSVRVMPVCLCTGEAAGIAAAMAAAAEAHDAHAVAPSELRQRLKAHGAYLP